MIVLPDIFCASGVWCLGGALLYCAGVAVRIMFSEVTATDDYNLLLILSNSGVSLWAAVGPMMPPHVPAICCRSCYDLRESHVVQ